MTFLLLNKSKDHTGHNERHLLYFANYVELNQLNNFHQTTVQLINAFTNTFLFF
jgi:hypothetical protein